MVVVVFTTNAQISIVDERRVLENVSFYKTTDDLVNEKPTALDKVILLKNIEKYKISIQVF